MKENPLKKALAVGTDTFAPQFSVTCANEFVIRVAMKHAKKHGRPFLVEATVNQVDQFGGYTGMKPADYAGMIGRIAKEVGMDLGQVVMSGDHLGPFTMQDKDEEEAMAYSRELVREYVKAGFRKIHLDTSMRLASDPQDRPLADEVSTRRAVELAKVSEEAYAQSAGDTPWSYRPVYIIGSEVPVPGGTEDEEELEVTKPESLVHTLDSYREAFLAASLPQVWDDVKCVVAQIGVEFSDEAVHDFDFEKAQALAKAAAGYGKVTFESHSSDYQTAANLKDMVASGVGILKVGPELTFVYREGLYALEQAEQELIAAYPGMQPSNFAETLERVMLTAEPNYWIKYYHGTPEQQKIKRKYSFSDRSRYYLTNPEVHASIERLMENTGRMDIPLTLISQYLPVQYERIRAGLIGKRAQELLEDKVNCVLDRYTSAL
ncbi:class II D-tagatose-bisphosphate aldolase non-catalytic subunit [Christensenella tenuis]|uniref:Class II D-tagatose-bisphosphate aldolase, non-catalytic subunit n=1 Tax=Christensenella tenuis TaxID=2763033 RepID=A0ABR7EFU8_9FIRM|nr:class II D-tagatose-bisphosphate aldolase, non-catalytic subunit [Christensenella tenuis]MBC5648533.1 class II D-tagatose-bisphosphate aldolase, non-catalytic subunit [Christensenella tenuis]